MMALLGGETEIAGGEGVLGVEQGSGAQDKHRLTALTGTVGLGLDALASVAYGRR
jgi:hypothetical protein